MYSNLTLFCYSFPMSFSKFGLWALKQEPDFFLTFWNHSLFQNPRTVKNIYTYYTVHFWRVVTSTWMDISNGLQSFFIPHIGSIRAIRWRKLKGGASSVVHVRRNHIVPRSMLCIFTLVFNCSSTKKKVKIVFELYMQTLLKCNFVYKHYF